MAEHPTQAWDLVAHERRHRVEGTGSVSRTVRWSVDGQVVAAKKSAEDTLRLKPGDRLKGEPDAGPDDQPARADPDLGSVTVQYTALGKPKRATWHPGGSVGAAFGTGGIDLEPEAGSPAALREERIRQRPRRYAVLAVVGGVAKVVLPLLLGLLVVRLTVALPWPDWDLPSIPWPDVDLPSIPWPDVDLPDWQAPAWVRWVADKAQYVWPILLAWVLARREIRRRREQDALRAQRRAEEQAEAGTGDDDRPASA
ncbi:MULTISPECIES: hypothetical protein [unclassified Modestobacter]|uniref:hypothetical protein n=1 Tax=unclassified Modestobacter TaxID=2643866 RepID=UPI0022AA3E80|nr:MULTISPECIES: hypothetical protein [unclassified Modestobacter]MCZ2827031.1 hypothetical protein [Modestobacter sp. VKM Ac-2981]MCZ2855273.1 hypothetical protein [Modestobacter sp. VKM Ac-2982]